MRIKFREKNRAKIINALDWESFSDASDSTLVLKDGTVISHGDVLIVKKKSIYLKKKIKP